MREICLDTETTGLSPKNGDRIIEIACIELVNKVQTGKHFHVYVNPRRDVPQEAFNVHGISTEFLQDKPIFDHIVDEFLEFIDGGILVAHNASFDMKFINHELNLVGKGPILKDRVVDSLALARRKFPGAPASLDALCRRFGVDLSKRTKHGALLDTELLCDVYVELTGGLQSGMAFNSDKKENDKNGASMADFLAQIKAKQVTKSRDFKVSDDELAAHKKFILDNLKENNWGY